MLRLTRNVQTIIPDDVYTRLEAEGSELLRVRDTALASDPRSETYRQYVARMQSYIAALAAYLNISRPRD